MAKGDPRPKAKPAEMKWEDLANPNCVAEAGWENEPQQSWTCTTCKKYVKMYHLMKIWPMNTAVIYGPRREGPSETCLSEHFCHRYHEVTIAVGVQNSRPCYMSYSTMAMVWAEIVLHKQVDWRTIYAQHTDELDRSQEFIPTNWNRPSDCYPLFSERKATGRSNFGAHQDPHRPGYGGHNRPPPIDIPGARYGGHTYQNEEYSPPDQAPVGYEAYNQPRYNTPPGGYGGYYNNYGHQEEGNPAPLSFGIGSGGYYPQPFPHYTTERSPTGAYNRGSIIPERHSPSYPQDTSGGLYGGYNVPRGYPSTYSPSPPVSPMSGPGEGYGRRHRTYNPSPPISPMSRSGEGYGGKSRRYNPSPPVSPYSRPKVPERDEESIEHPSFGYGQHPYGKNDMPPPPFRTQPTQEEQDARYEADLREAMRQSQQERINQLEDEQRYNESMWEAYSRGHYPLEDDQHYNESQREAYPRGRYDSEAGPSRKGKTKGKGKGKVESDSD